MAVVILKSPPHSLPGELEVIDDNVKSGGEGTVYFSRDGKYAVKIYHKARSEKEALLKYIMSLFQSLTSEEEKFIIPPLSLIESLDGQCRTGFVMRRVPKHYRELSEFILPRQAAAHFNQGKTWEHYFKLAHSISKSIVVLHNKGFAHSDIHYYNFMVNINDGEAIMLEIDGVVVAGFLPPQVVGKMEFMAPEILTDKIKPNEKTDRYSMAVLILHTLLFRNVMKPLVEYDNDTELSEILGWGKYALFSENPEEHRHRPRNLGLPFYQEGALSYKILPPLLQDLANRALIDGLNNPDKRPASREWEESLSSIIYEIFVCQNCKQKFPYPYWVNPAYKRICPFCGEKIKPPYPALLELYEEKSKGIFSSLKSHLVIMNGSKIFPDMITVGNKPSFTRKSDNISGYVEFDQKKGHYFIVNNEDAIWHARFPNENRQFTVQKGQSLTLTRCCFINFGDGRRMAYVKE